MSNQNELFRFLNQQQQILLEILEQQRIIHQQYFRHVRAERYPRENQQQQRRRQHLPQTFYFTTHFPVNTTQQSFEDNVPVPAPASDIEQSTERLVYSNDLSINTTQCPISMEAFQQGDELLKITHCGHTFLKVNLERWFETRPTCPVCRYDIRQRNQQQTQYSFDISSSAIDDLFDSMFRNIANQPITFFNRPI